jgi:hypothetical protein
VCDRGHLAARIQVRSSPKFYSTVQSAAKRAQLTVADYTRQALVDKMALDVVRDAVMEGSDND